MTSFITRETTEALTDKLGQTGWQRLASLYLIAMVILLPIKLGSSLNNSGVAFFPVSGNEWIYAPWPPFLLPVISGLGLLLVLVAAPPRMSVLHRYLHLWLPVAILIPVTLIGFVRTTEWDQALLFFWHVLGILLAVLAVLLQLAVVPRLRGVLLWGVVVGGGLAAISGWQQVFYGFDDTKKMILKAAQYDPEAVNTAILNRLNERRAFATFTYPNNFAAHLILVIPVTLYAVWQASRHVEPERPSQIVLTSLVAILTVGIFVQARSRAAVVAIVLGALATLVIYAWQQREWLRRHKLQIAVGVVAMVIAAAVMLALIRHGRGLSSLEARADYYRSALLMFKEHPLTGAGMGEFFPQHLRLKPPGAEETRLTHNLFLHFLGQCGIAGGLAALYFLLFPLIVWIKACRGQIPLVSRPLYLACFFGFTNWAAHSMADFNVHIPGTMVTAVLLPILAVDWTQVERPRPSPERGALWRIVLTVLALTGTSHLWRIPGEYRFQVFCNDLRKPRMAAAFAKDAREIAKYLPYTPYPWDYLGKIALRQQDLDIAEMAFREALKRTPHRAAYHAYLAEVLAAKGEYREARSSIDTALKWYPHKPRYQQIAQNLRAAKP